MTTKKYQRKIIGVEKKLGFMYVPSVGQTYMPITTGKVKVLLEGEPKVTSLTYNVDHKRIFGLTSWYNTHKIKEGTVLNIELSEELVTVSIANESLPQPETEEEEKEDEYDLSGLSSSAKGNIVEDRIKELVLLHGQGLLNVYRPVIDNRGIDLIVMRDGVFQPIFLQVKSRFNASKNESLLIEIRNNTFTAHNSFYIIGVSFNPTTLEVDDKILFIPSHKVESISNDVKSYNKMRITVSMKSGSKAKAAQYFIKKSELVEKLMEKFEEMSIYYK